MRTRTLGAVVVIAMLSGCSSTTTIINNAPSAPSTSPVPDCFDRDQIVELSESWQETAQDLSEMATNEEIALDLAAATAADPEVATAYTEAADAYAEAPDPSGNITSSELVKTTAAMADGAAAMGNAIGALSRSSVPFCDEI